MIYKKTSRTISSDITSSVYSFHYRMVLNISVFAAALAILFACGKHQAKDEEMLSRVGHMSEIIKLPYKTMDINSFLSQNNCLKCEVRMTKPEVSNVWPDGIFEGMAHGVGIGLLGIGAAYLNPMLGSSSGVGGIISAPVIITMGVINSIDKSAVVKAFQETDLPGRVHHLLDQKLSAFFRSQCDDYTKIQLLIRYYGLFTEYPSEVLWFYCDADIKVEHSGEIIFEDSIIWRAQKRSKDVPPPRSGTLGTFANDNGKLTREMLIEASEVLAAIVVKRLNIHD